MKPASPTSARRRELPASAAYQPGAGLLRHRSRRMPASTTARPNNPTLGIHPGLGASREGVPFVDVSGLFTYRQQLRRRNSADGQYLSMVGQLELGQGNHTMKFGGDVRRMRFDQTLYYNVNGYYSYFGGGPTTSVQRRPRFPTIFSACPTASVRARRRVENVRSTDLYLFAQDSWKIRTEPDPELRSALGADHSAHRHQPARADLPSRASRARSIPASSPIQS